MSDVAFSFVTAVFTIGGLAGSLVANLIIDSSGRRGTHRLCAILVVVGTAFMGLGSSLILFLLGRCVQFYSRLNKFHQIISQVYHWDCFWTWLMCRSDLPRRNCSISHFWRRWLVLTPFVSPDFDTFAFQLSLPN